MDKIPYSEGMGFDDDRKGFDHHNLVTIETFSIAIAKL
jgi:hypothetical protein